MTERERERERQAEGEAGSVQGARRGTGSRVSRVTRWAEGGAKPLGHRGCPITYHFDSLLFSVYFKFYFLFFFKILFIYS